MTKHELARRMARSTCPVVRRAAVRRRKRWLAKQHQKAIAAALAAKGKA